MVQRKKPGGSPSTPGNRAGPSVAKAKGTSSTGSKKSGASTPALAIDQRELDMSGLNLDPNPGGLQEADVPVPKVLAREKLLEEVRKSSQIHGENNKMSVNLVVIGEVAHAVISFAGKC